MNLVQIISTTTVIIPDTKKPKHANYFQLLLIPSGVTIILGGGGLGTDTNASHEATRPRPVEKQIATHTNKKTVFKL